MSASNRSVCLAGLLLFLFGLIVGFAIPAFPLPRQALSAHLNAVQSGAALIAIGLVWPWLRLSGGTDLLLRYGTNLAFWTLEAGMILKAIFPPNGAGAAIANLFLAAGGLVMTVAVALLAGALWRNRPDASQP